MDCDHLTYDEKNGDAVCRIHGLGKREQWERDWPEAPPILHKKCGYYFWDRWDKKIVKYGQDL